MFECVLFFSTADTAPTFCQGVRNAIAVPGAREGHLFSEASLPATGGGLAGTTASHGGAPWVCDSPMFGLTQSIERTSLTTANEDAVHWLYYPENAVKCQNSEEIELKFAKKLGKS